MKYRKKKFQLQLNSFVLLFFLTSLFFAQNTKNIYTTDLDSLWSRSTYLNQMTTDGNWVIFTEVFDHKDNVTTLKHTTDTISFKFKDSQWLKFADNNRWFGCVVSGNELKIVDLLTKSIYTYHGVQGYTFSKSGDYIAAFNKGSNAKDVLSVINLKTKSKTNLKNVLKYIWHPLENKLLITTQGGNKNQVVVYNAIDSKLTTIKEDSEHVYNYSHWSNTGNSFLFLEQQKNEISIHFKPLNDNVKTLTDSLMTLKFPNYKISSREPYISSDGKKILFYRCSIESNKYIKNESLEVWDSDHPLIYPKLMKHRQWEIDYLLTAWYPETNQLKAIETIDRPTSALHIDHKYALVYDMLEYEPQYKEFPNADIYVKNIESGKEQLVVKNQYTGPGFITVSPQGKYISYFKDSHWWIYNIEKNLTYNLTAGLNVTFNNLESDYAGDTFSYGIPAWSENDSYIVLTDQYDLWLMSPDNNFKKRITKGREQRIKNRISKESLRNNLSYLTVNRSFSSIALNLHKGFVIELYNEELHHSGYAMWSQKNKYREIVLEDIKLDGVLVSEGFKNIVFRKQKFNIPPSINNIDLKANKQNLIFQSNEKLTNYELGKAQLINYKVDDITLTASLIYPANFNPLMKYPMIVSVYEKKSSYINSFSPPSVYEYDGFNTLKYNTNGYFVLYPDIKYSIQNPGMSALKSINAVVYKTLETGIIDKNKIGLIGHSFGGYESAFISTQTDMFSAIVAGAPVTDFTSHYHSVGWDWDQPEMWRYESQQWRMGSSYYDVKKAYFENSPIHHVENVKTPILLWSGKKDQQVHWTQSIEMFLALKRLGKKSKLLLFNNEKHAIFNKENQKKLSNQIMDWFDTYCK